MNPHELIIEVIDQIRGMWRYRWWAVLVSWVTAIAGVLFIYSLPPVYSASTQVFIDTNSQLGPMMRGSAALQDPMNGVQAVGRTVLARPNIERVARDSGLAASVQTQDGLERLVTGLQREIQIEGGRDNTFSISFSDTSRETARDVVAAVLNTFVEGAIGQQGDDAVVTEQALASEIKDHEDRLLKAEAALAAFKKDNIGFMPNEYGDYASRLQAALAQVRASEERIRLVTERRDAIQRQIDGERNGAFAASCSYDDQIKDLTAQTTALQVDYTDRHPRLVAIRERIAALEERCAAETRGIPYPGASAVPGSPVYQDLRIQLNNAEVELAQLGAELESQQGRVAELRRDVDTIAAVETQLTQLNRDYDVVRGRHQELLMRWETLQAKQRLEPVTDTIQFRVIEPPFAHAQAVGPNRPLFIVGVLLAAIGAGVGLAFGLNRLRPVFLTRAKLRRAVALPVLGAVSMISPRRAAIGRALGTFAWSASYLLLLVGAALAVAFAGEASDALRALLSGRVS